MPDDQMHQTGMSIRKEMFGADVVERRMSSMGEFGAPLQKLINQYAYGEIWGREALPRKMRSLLVLAMMCAANRPHELRIHLRGAITNWTLWVGVIKAPFFAVIISMVGCYEGFNVTGSADSVGRLTTQSVVESIFLVIVVDAAFSILKI